MLTERTSRLIKHIPTSTLIQELRRRGESPPTPEVVRVSDAAGDLVIDLGFKLAQWRGQRAVLTAKEADVLAVLARAHPAPMLAAAIGKIVWPDVDSEDAKVNVRVYVMYLRVKLPGLIESEPFIGYWLAADRAVPS